MTHRSGKRWFFPTDKHLEQEATKAEKRFGHPNQVLMLPWFLYIFFFEAEWSTFCSICYSTVDVHHSKSNLNLSKQNEIQTVPLCFIAFDKSVIDNASSLIMSQIQTNVERTVWYHYFSLFSFKQPSNSKQVLIIIEIYIKLLMARNPPVSKRTKE